MIVEFLEELLQSMAEPMPEATGGGSLAPRHMAFRRTRGRRPRLAAVVHRAKKNDARSNNPTKAVLRFLPPGTFSDYLSLFKARYPEAHKVSLKLFNKVPCLETARCAKRDQGPWHGYQPILKAMRMFA